MMYIIVALFSSLISVFICERVLLKKIEKQMKEKQEELVEKKVDWDEIIRESFM